MTARLDTRPRQTLRQAISELGGTCAFALFTLTQGDTGQRRRAKSKLFVRSFRVAMLLLDDPDIDLDYEETDDDAPR